MSTSAMPPTFHDGEHPIRESVKLIQTDRALTECDCHVMRLGSLTHYGGAIA